MRLAYLYPEHLGREHARVLQVAATLRAMAGLGAHVHLLAGSFAGLSARLARLGLGEVAGLHIEPVVMCQPGPGSIAPFSWGGVYQHFALRRLGRLAAAGVSAVMVRHLKLADWLIAKRSTHGLPLLYEAHELFAQTAAEEGMTGPKLTNLADMERRVLAGADVVAAISAPLAEALEAAGRRRGPVVLAPSGVDDEFFAVDEAHRSADLLAYAGGLGPWKGVDLLLRALALVPAARLEILGGEQGSADWRRLEALASELALGDRLCMRPRADQEAVRELLARAAVAVWPGTASQRIAAEFTSPLKLFEYLAAGCAVIGPDVPAARAVLAAGQNASLFAPDDPTALAAAIAALLGDPARAKAMGRAGRELARRYAWRNRAAVILDALEKATP